MAEHRRVEPRQIAGTGMATDPERIQQVIDDAERRSRAWRPAPEAGFGDVLGRAPPRGELADATSGPPLDPDGDRAGTGPGPSDALASVTPAAEAASGRPFSPPRPVTRPSPRAPDPRARLLNARLDQRAQPAPMATSIPTPTPTPPSRK